MIVSVREAAKMLAEHGHSIGRAKLARVVADEAPSVADGDWSHGRSMRLDFEKLLSFFDARKSVKPQATPDANEDTEYSDSIDACRESELSTDAASVASFPGDWVSLSEARDRLNRLRDPVTLSALSYYVRQHAESIPTERRWDLHGAPVMVPWEVLRNHRAENIRLLYRRAADVGRARGNAKPIGNPDQFAGGQAHGAARKVQAEAALREIDLAERQHLLVPRDEVDRAGREAVALMMAAFDRALDATPARAAIKFGWDERQLRTVLKDHVKEGLGIFHREMLERIESLAKDNEQSRASDADA